MFNKQYQKVSVILLCIVLCALKINAQSAVHCKLVSCQLKKNYPATYDYFFIVDKDPVARDTIRLIEGREFDLTVEQLAQRWLVYDNIVGNQVWHDMRLIRGQEDYKVCFDAGMKDGLFLFHQISEKRPLTIEHVSIGCFHSDASSISIELKDGEKKLTLFVGGKKRRSKILTESEWERMLRFERTMHKYGLKVLGGCTTREYYEVKLGDNHYSFEDGSCDWRGWMTLLESLHIWKKR